MSEALSANEIEDVLASIRRLVADDLRPNPAARQAPAQGDKLLLTPALRVVTSEPGAQDLGRLASNIGAVVPDTQDWEAEAGDAFAEAGAEVETAEIWTDFALEPEADAPAEMAEEVDETPAESAEILAFTHAAPVEDSADEALSEDWPAEDEVAPEGAFTVAEEEVLAPADDSAETGTPIIDEAPLAFVSVRVASDEPMPGWAQEPETGEEPEALAEDSLTGATLEPDPEWADAAEASVLAELAEAPPELDPYGADIPQVMGYHEAGEGEFPEGGEPVYDEALLREIVRDLLREELQGSMGERITRNIRKLVRAEIARALATQDIT